jgi:hypothetical protein
MPSATRIEIEIPDDLAWLQLPERLPTLLDKQDASQPLTGSERREAERLVNLNDLLSLLRCAPSESAVGLHNLMRLYAAAIRKFAVSEAGRGLNAGHVDKLRRILAQLYIAMVPSELALPRVIGSIRSRVTSKVFGRLRCRQTGASFFGSLMGKRLMLITSTTTEGSVSCR